uniref:cadherin-like beta sandwich domain-containing protein n=1 Tax=Nocardioides sp. R-C-SC26 TaxID=2870414 RepID=UPI001E584EBA
LQTYGAAVYGANNWASPDAVELFTAAEGRVGVATVDNGALVVDRYDAETWTKVGSRTQIAFGDWNLYGGFLAADDGTFYLLLGRSNRQENDARDVIAVRRYSASWQLLGTAYVAGGVNQGVKGVVQPFDASSADMMVVGSRLVVHMGRLMYKTGDKVNHQANLTFEVDTATMRATPFEKLGDAPYTSHSFQQLITTVGNDLVMLDHGDAFPRAIRLNVMRGYLTGARDFRAYDVLEFPGDLVNYTGTTVTGLASGPSRILTVGNSVPHGKAIDGVRGSDAELSRNVYAISTDPATGASAFRWITTLAPRGQQSAGEPRLVQLEADRFALIFGTRRGNGPVMQTLEYRLIDSAGAVLASRSWRQSFAGPSADPLLVGGRLLWAGFPAQAGGMPASPSIFGLDLTDPTNPQRLGSAAPPEPGPAQNTESRLGALRVKGASITPSFSPDQRSYRVALARGAGAVRLSAHTRSTAASLSFSTPRGWAAWPTCGRSSSCGVSVGLNPGERYAMRIRVVAGSGAQTIYTLNLVRPRR